MGTIEFSQLNHVTAPLAYLGASAGPVEHRIYPPGSGIPTTRPPIDYQPMPIYDARAISDRLSLDECGIELRRHRSAVTDFYDETAVRTQYYPEVEAFMRAATGATAVLMFDHNTRSAVRAERGDRGVRMPVDAVHNDYTEQSGPRRAREILEAAGRTDLLGRRVAFINVWRPIVGPVQDIPLAVCDARSVSPADLVATDIHHFGEDDLSKPRHSGQIYSIRHNPAHRWFFVSDMQPDEVLLLKCFDSRQDGRARFMPHTGFRNPACPPAFIPRESIEARTLAVF